MHVLLFFIAILIAGAVTGLAFILSANWLTAGLTGLCALWFTEGLFERYFGYHPVLHWPGQDNLPVH